MKFLTTFCLLALTSFPAVVMAAEEVIWSGPGRLERGDTIEAQNGNCRLRMNVASVPWMTSSIDGLYRGTREL